MKEKDSFGRCRRWHEIWHMLLKRGGGGTFLDKAENTMCLINFFSNWYSDLYQKWQYIGIFHTLRIFWCLKLLGQSISFCTATHLHGTPTRNLHFCVLFVHRYLFSKWYHYTSFKLDLLFVSYKLYLSRFYWQIFSLWITLCGIFQIPHLVFIG